MDKNRQNPDRVKKFMRHLLTATCLTAAGACAANADVFTESTDFSDTIGAATPLPAGTTEVIGAVFEPPGNFDDLFDFFEFTGLPGSAAFKISFASTLENVVGAQVFDSAQNPLGPLPFGVGFGLSFPGSISGTVPSDGVLIVGISAEEGGPYTADLATGDAVPEPSTVPLTGLGLALAGGVDWWRRRQKR